jgi:glycosyltransferase involved in cell wall biosynthesis
MRILHIAPSYKPAYTYGGTIESIAKLCEALAAAGEDVTVFTTTANGKTELDVTPGKEYNIEGVNVIYFNRQTKDHSHISVDLWKQLNHECKNYDAIHIHSWWNVLVTGAVFTCKRKKVKPVISPHGMLSDYILQHSNAAAKKLMYITGGKNLLRYSFLHATSEAEFAECKKLIPGWQGSTIANIISLPPLNMYKKENPVFTILFLSRIHPKKGIELLMEAISKLPVNVCLKIAGTGEEQYVESLKRKAESLGIQNKLQWLGWQNRDEKFEVLMRADLFALTSYNENFANVIVESLHAGTPVLLSEKVGLSGFVESHDLGWVCSLDPEDIAQKIKAAIDDIEKRKRIHHSAASIIRHYFSPETLIPQYLQLYCHYGGTPKSSENFK